MCAAEVFLPSALPRPHIDCRNAAAVARGKDPAAIEDGPAADVGQAGNGIYAAGVREIVRPQRPAVFHGEDLLSLEAAVIAKPADGVLDLALGSADTDLRLDATGDHHVHHLPGRVLLRVELLGSVVPEHAAQAIAEKDQLGIGIDARRDGCVLRRGRPLLLRCLNASAVHGLGDGRAEAQAGQTGQRQDQQEGQPSGSLV